MGLDGLLRCALGRRRGHRQRHRRSRSGIRRPTPPCRSLQRAAHRQARPRNKAALQAQLGLAPNADGAAVRRRIAAVRPEGARPSARRAAAARRAGRRSSRCSAPATGALEAGFADAAAAASAARSACVFGYDEALAHLFQAGADFIVVPVALRALRADPALRAALWRGAGRGAGRRPRRHGDRRQRSGARGRRRDRHTVLAAFGRALELRARPRARRSTRDADAMRRMRLNGMRADVSWRRPAQRYAALYRSIAGTAADDETRPPSLGVAADGARARGRAPAAERRAPSALPVYDGRPRSLARRDDPRRRRASCAASAPGFGAGARYGFRVDGPFDPARGARFDASKLLADPYAWAFDRPFRLHPSMFAFGDDSGAVAPKAIAGAPPAGEPGRKRIAADALVIYELNLRGFSRLNPAIPEGARGTFAGLAHPASIAHLACARRHRGRDHAGRRLRRRAASAGRSACPTPGATIRSCSASPDPRLAPGGWAEVRAATDALHAAGIEAILDVVFNHNGESDQFGPTLSFRGLDNAAFFRLDPANPARLHQRHGHRQLPRARPAARHRHGDRRAAALDDPRRHRRLPLRSCDRARPTRPRASIPMRRSSRRLRPIPCSRRRASSPSLGISAPAAISSAASARPSANGTTSFATPPGASGAATPGMRGEIRHPHRRLARCVRRRRRAVAAASTSSSPTTASRSPTSSPTTTSTTRRTASTIATARTTIPPGTTASRGRAKTRRSSRRAPATSAIC